MKTPRMIANHEKARRPKARDGGLFHFDTVPPTSKQNGISGHFSRAG